MYFNFVFVCLFFDVCEKDLSNKNDLEDYPKIPKAQQYQQVKEETDAKVTNQLQSKIKD